MRVLNGRWTPICVAIILTIMRKNGLVDMIDSGCRFDRKQRIITPGEAVLLIVGATVLRNRRIPLYKIGEQYANMNLRGILGRDVTLENLSDSALGRALDTLYDLDRKQMLWDISEKFEFDLGLLSRIYHLDQTKIRTYVADEPPCNKDAAKPMFGIDKEKRTDFRLYSANAITSEYKFIKFLDPQDGNKTDSEMDEDAIRFLIENVETDKSTVITDSKGTTSRLCELMDESGLGFVSKVPENFSCNLRSRVGQIAFNEGWSASKKKGHRFIDIDMKVKPEDESADWRIFRIVAFQSEKMLSDARASMIRKGKKISEKISKELSGRCFESESDAYSAVGTALESLCDSGYSLKWELVSEDVCIKREGKGRPPKDEAIRYRTVWRIRSVPVVDDEMIELITQRDSYQVLITNLPRPLDGEVCETLRQGSEKEQVLKLYLNQYKQEHNFSLLKGKVGMAQVFFSKPERENVMIFVLGLAVLMRNLIDYRFSREKGVFTTAQDMVDRWNLVRIRVIDHELEIDGAVDVENRFVDVMRRLGLDEGMIIDSIQMA